MSKLYYTSPYLKCFTCEIVEAFEKSNAYHIVLDQTLFYPGGGGVPCDTGFIGDCEITDVYEENGRIYHISSKKPTRIHKVQCTLNWQRRFDSMQQHTLQHMLSAYLVEHFNTQTLSFHLGQETCILTIDTLLPKDCISTLEHAINEAILADYTITSFVPTKKELKKLPIRGPLPKTKDDLRLVEIESLDLTPCCAIHLKSTLDAQLLIITKIEKHKQGQSLTFLGGKRAITHLYQSAQSTLQTQASLTSTIKKLEAEVRTLQSTLTDYKVQEYLQNALSITQDIRVIKEVLPDTTAKSLQTFANKLVQSDKVVALLGCINEGACHMVFMCSQDLTTLKMNTLLQDSITLIDGRGGGTPTSAQGGGKSIANLDSALDYAFMKIKSSL